MTRSTIACATLVIAALVFAGRPARAGDIEVLQPWLRATPNGAPVAGGYATIVNHGRMPDTLVGASLTVALTGEVHEMSMTNGVMHMARLADGLAIAPGATVTLSPGGDHLMFEKPSTQLKQGQRVAGSLIFAKAGKISVTFAVAGIGARNAPDEPTKGVSIQKMPGMKMNR